MTFVCVHFKPINAHDCFLVEISRLSSIFILVCCHKINKLCDFCCMWCVSVRLCC